MAMNRPPLEPGQRIDIPSVPNLRDIGGYAVAGGGHVRTGQLYRSVELNHLRGVDLERFCALGIRTVFDLRTTSERAAEPDKLPPGVRHVICDVLADTRTAAPARLWRAISDPAQAEHTLGGDRALGLFERAYRDIVTLPSALCAYRTFFVTIAEQLDRPALFHCTTGKDRTGWAAASTLMLLGVSDEDVLYDYELTNRDLLPALKPVFEHFTAAGGDRRLLEPMFGVDRRYLLGAIDEVKKTFGSIDAYFADGLGITADTQQTLRDELTER
jgi:protein-tyrosine phosphatase